jgi:tRNA A37 threonylcarbamoyladenosine modification protein TsaB
MYKILIDSTDRYKKSVKLIKNDTETIEEEEGDLDIVSTIEKILLENKMHPKDIIFFDVNPGPGSFTGLKIGTTIANVLNWALGLKKSNELTYPNYGRETNITLQKDMYN